MKPKCSPVKECSMDEIKAMGLTESEYQKAKEILGRTPNYTEVGMISAMWSEHCSYKSSRVHLRRFPSNGPNVLEGPGENAGVVDIGEGLACVFKVESHNHPSFIEPYQGAATGVGGILRDVFTMGARPLANFNSLHFGQPDQPRMRYLVGGVVAGIGDYGNCIGVPTVGGQVSFNACYNGNILVNAFTLGIVKSDKYFKAAAQGEGNPIFYVGSRTGRDGIHGATMASESFDTQDPEAQEKRPTVQVGDPFTEKLLLEACLELMKTDCIVGIQDMGAAGLTSSSFEMAGRAGTGVVLNLDKIPCREEAMTPYELMLSESQERMLLVVRKGAEKRVQDIFEKWGLQASEVGVVNTDSHVTLNVNGQTVARLPALPLAQNAPQYERPMKKPAYLQKTQNQELDFKSPSDMVLQLKRLLGSPNVCSRHWVYEQYDSSVRTNTVQGPGGDAALLRIKESKSGKAIAISSDVNARYTYLDPFTGAALAVAEACRNVSCVGASPIGLTNCLNFGNPENPEIMWQFSQAVDGMTKACNELGVPIVSGNVSLYNETDHEGIYPTPTIVGVGLLQDVRKSVGIGFQSPEDLVILLGEVDGNASLGASEYLSFFYQRDEGVPPAIQWQLEKNLQKLCREAIGKGLLRSAHDVSDGGLLIAVAEMALASSKNGKQPFMGAEIKVNSPKDSDRPDCVWFGEKASRVLVTITPKDLPSLNAVAQELKVPLRNLGKVVVNQLIFQDKENTHQVNVADLYQPWRNSFAAYMDKGKFL